MKMTSTKIIILIVLLIIFVIVSVILYNIFSTKSQESEILSKYFTRLFPLSDISNKKFNTLKKLYLNLDCWYTDIIPYYKNSILKNIPNWTNDRMNLWDQEPTSWCRLYDGSICDCIRYSYPICKKRTGSIYDRDILKRCPIWEGLNVGKNYKSTLTQAYNTNNNSKNYVSDIYTLNGKGYPNYAWFEGLSYPGEHGIPNVCELVENYEKEKTDKFGSYWLYPLRGVGVWRNIGNSVVSNTKLGYLLTSKSKKSLNGTSLGGGYTIEYLINMSKKYTEIGNLYDQYTRLKSVIKNGSIQKTSHYPYISISDLKKHGYDKGKLDNDVDAKNAAYELLTKWYKNGYTGLDNSIPNGFNYNYKKYFPIGTYFSYFETYDDLILSTMVENQIDTIQLVIEPQNATSGLRPAYIFEILQAIPKTNNNWSYFNDTTSNQCKELYMIDPFDDFDNYNKYGYCENKLIKHKDIFNPTKMNLTPLYKSFTDLPTIGFKDINDKFTSHNGITVVMSGYRDQNPVNDKYQKSKIYLENNATPHESVTSLGTMDLTYLSSKIPLNVYARKPYDITIGLILDTDILIQMGMLQCGTVLDDGSVARVCHDSKDDCSCIKNEEFKSCNDSEAKEFNAVISGCGTKCKPDNNSGYKTCNKVYWCDDHYTDEKILNEWSKSTESGWHNLKECKFRPLDKNDPTKINKLFIQSIINYKKNNQKLGSQGYYENELDATVKLDEKHKNMWLKAILGVFHDTDSSVMCACSEGESCTQDCCDSDMSKMAKCQQQHCDINECKSNSIRCVKNMVNEYNTNISNITGHKIQGWNMKGLNRNTWVGWNKNNNYTVDLSKYLVKIL